MARCRWLASCAVSAFSQSRVTCQVLAATAGAATLRITRSDAIHHAVQTESVSYAQSTFTYVAQDIHVSASSLDFGSQIVELGATATQTVSITNAGTGILTISDVSLFGTDQTEFAIESDSGETALGTGASRTVSLSFDPSSLGSLWALLRVSSDDPEDSVVDIGLNGEGVSSAVFGDGFESGTTSLWSSAMP